MDEMTDIKSETLAEKLTSDYREWLVSRSQYCLHFSLIYMLMVFLGKWIMQEKKPLPLNKLFLFWNISLTIFSVAGTISVFPEFFDTITQRGFFASYCRINNDYYTGRNGYWVYLFHISKLFELGDTIFLVLRKRPIILLHWYHHATVLAYTWLTYDQNVGPTRWGVMMNFLVHAIMYGYYAAKSARISLPSLLAPCITSLQMFQFIIGLWACTHALYVLAVYGEQACDVTFASCVSSVVLYLSYFVLFAKFFRQSYLVGKKKRVATVHENEAPLANGVDNKKMD